MKSKFVSLLVCMTTSLSLVSMPKVQAQAVECQNIKQVQCSSTSTQKTQDNKTYIKKIEQSPSVFLGDKEIKNAPKYVNGILSPKMSKNSDNIMDFFEINKDIFRISDPKNQLELLRDSGNVFRFSQVVNGITTDNTYIVIFNDNNQIETVHGVFDNSLYEANSEANVTPIITKGQAFQIAKAHEISNIHNDPRLPSGSKENLIKTLIGLECPDYNKIKTYICKYTGYDEFKKGKYFKTYKIENMGLADVYVSVTTGEIISNRSLIMYNN